MLDYSILLPVYRKDKPSLFFSAAYSCILAMRATNYTGELILLQDGPIGLELDNVINYFLRTDLQIRHEISHDNIGLAGILNRGAHTAAGKFLIRLDADDEMVVARLGIQIQYMKRNNIDICGSYIYERNRAGEIKTLTHYPINHADILHFMKYRCPFAHPSITLRRAAFLDENIYPTDRFPEDYHLWYRGVSAGLKYGNIPEFLTLMNLDEADLKRRGSKFFLGESKLLFQMYQDNFINIREFSLLLLGRVILRLTPLSFRAWLYKRFRNCSL